MTIEEFNAVWEKAYQAGYDAAKIELLSTPQFTFQTSPAIVPLSKKEVIK